MDCLRAIAFATCSTTIGLSACAPAAGEGDGCFGKCDGFGDGVGEVLASRADPIARFLRESGIDDEGFIDVDFGSMLFGLSDLQGCAIEDVKTFVVSDDLLADEGSGAFPRMVSAACTSDATKASEFFMALSFESDEEAGEMDLAHIEAYAWDSQSRQYNFYESEGAERGGVRMDPTPKACMECHQTPSDLAAVAMPMTPIMNELTRPWTHWNASPGFPSFGFEVPDRALESDSWRDWVEPRPGQADQLEQLIRAGQDRVASARVRGRRDPVDLDKAMALLRPVFCSEQVNYASEEFTSGSLNGSAVLDPGIRGAFRQIRPDNWPWAWVNDDNIRLPQSGGAIIEQLPVRGNADVATENLLMQTNVLSPFQVLRVRALDYTRPIFSDFRCGLWREAQARFGASPPDLSAAVRISDALPILFDAIMTLGPQALKPVGAEGVIAMPIAGTEQSDFLLTALGEGSLTNDCTAGACELTVDELGAALEAHYDTFAGEAGRSALFTERDRRICHIIAEVTPADDRFEDETAARFANHPSLPEAEGCAE